MAKQHTACKKPNFKPMQIATTSNKKGGKKATPSAQKAFKKSQAKSRATRPIEAGGGVTVCAQGCRCVSCLIKQGDAQVRTPWGGYRSGYY